jgi:hypothetical protein
MNTNIFLPKKIKVGYQNRRDTYTEKLAFVTYYDEKNVLRKEKSWEGWRDKSINPSDYDNIPTNGFVLNKKVGGGSSGWNNRQTYTRIYDPRGFEFEISIQNLLYILEHTNSIKGKGLEGEFVYGWSGTELLLLPVESPDYIEITNHTNRIFNKTKIKVKDLVIGKIYVSKKNEPIIYMGKYDNYSYGGLKYKEDPKYYFYNENNKSRYSNSYNNFETLSNVSSLIGELGVLDNIKLSEYLEDLTYCEKIYPVDPSKDIQCKLTIDKLNNDQSYININCKINNIDSRILRYSDDHKFYVSETNYGRSALYALIDTIVPNFSGTYEEVCKLIENLNITYTKQFLINGNEKR